MLAIGVGINQLSLTPFLTPLYRSYEWNWFESQVSLALRILTDGAAQIIASFISFGTLHIHTSGFEPWQWYDQAQHLANLLVIIFL